MGPMRQCNAGMGEPAHTWNAKGRIAYILVALCVWHLQLPSLAHTAKERSHFRCYLLSPSGILRAVVLAGTCVVLASVAKDI